MIWQRKRETESVIPTGQLVHLGVNDFRASPENPRVLFDAKPLADLKASISEHGVLVPLTVYKLPGQERYGIVDGERRYRCCRELSEEGRDVQIPANVVAAPEPMASLIYMFNIHQFRQQWELMPTANALRSVIEGLGTQDTGTLTELTGLSERQIERCKLLLSFSDRHQELSLNPDPKVRIPSNFWVELSPVLDLTGELLPDLLADEGRDSIVDRLVDKYRRKRIRSVIHFRRIMEAYDAQEEEEDQEGIDMVAGRLREYILDPDMETRAAFDGFIVQRRSRQRATQAVDKFMNELRRARIEHVTEGREALIGKLTEVLDFIATLLGRLEGDDPPSEEETY